MKAAVIGRQGAEISGFLLAAANGLRRQGVDVTVSTDEAAAREHDFALCWGWRRGLELQRLGAKVLVAERGYIGDRFKWTSLTWDGLNGRGEFCLGQDVPALDDTRREMLAGLLRPWRRYRGWSGHRIIIMGQVPGDMSLQGHDLGRWYLETAKSAAELFKFPVVFRPHPVAKRRTDYSPSGLPEITGTMEEALETAAFVATWNSNSAVDAVLFGVPAVVMDAGSMAWPVAAHGLDEIKTDAPEPAGRTAWAARLTWCQWSQQELAAGSWWQRMARGLERYDVS